MNRSTASGTLKVAVVGHTNTGKTSLLRTLTRDVGFGEISNRPSTTRHVEGTALLVDGEPLVELYDTPGLEDSSGLLDLLMEFRQGRRTEGIELIRRFLDSPAAGGEFEQEAKALRQVLGGNVALYVVDARDRVLGKHRDELEILGYCARPVLPVLNFVSSRDARTREWREHMARVNMHAVVEFDTVVLEGQSERRLFEKMQTLLDGFRDTLQRVIDDHARQRSRLSRAAAELLADLIIDAGAYVVTAPAGDQAAMDQAGDTLKDAVRQREQRCVDSLLELYRFRAADYAGEDLPIAGGQWGLDLFSHAALRQFGVQAGSAAAAGGMAGLAVDVLLGGASLGAGAAIGATLGAIWSTAGRQGRKLADWMRGYTELRVAQGTLQLLALRQMDLIRALNRRGHAAQGKIQVAVREDKTLQTQLNEELQEVLETIRLNPEWSRLNVGDAFEPDPDRVDIQTRLAQWLETAMLEGGDASRGTS